jgi:anaerobic selenocysteine-containing dehydrogenase
MRVERFRPCPLCEAGCGLAFELEEGRPTTVRPDHDDALSKGFVCPKGLEILNLERDPDRVTTPLRRAGSGAFESISWPDAFDLIETRLKGVRRAHGKDAIAVYFGTVFVHKYSVMLVRNALKTALDTRNWTGVSSQDTTARFVSAYLLYGSTMSISVPDIDRTSLLVCIGANPVVSNGSMMTAPDAGGRIRAIRERGGKVVVIDPRRSETAEIADEHVSIRPGTDAAFVLSLIQALVAGGRVDTPRMRRQTRGWDDLEARLVAFAPERVERFVGVPAATIERLALEFAAASSSVAYSRMGPSCSRHATLACYAVELLNLVAGRLGEPGGAMFPTPAIDVGRLSRIVRADGFDRYRSRVRGLPETVGELPSTILAEEMETPGPGQVKALLTYAGNPVLSVPNGRRLERALAGLDFMVSIDPYINETTRFADLILPPAPALAEDHADFFFANMAVRDGMRWSPAVVERRADERLDWEILLEIADRMGGGIMGIRPVDALLRALSIRVTPATLANVALRTGPYGDHFLPWSKGINRARLEKAPHGVDLGPLKPGFRHRVRHRGRRLEVAAPVLMRALEALAGELTQAPDPRLLLIGRRELRSNNSWMHNVPRLVAGKKRCLLFVNPVDAARAGVEDGGRAIMASRIHRGEVTVHLTDEVREGVVSLPHGYGHAALKRWQRVAGDQPGPSLNDWLDDSDVEAIAGVSILNGVPVELAPARAEDPGLSGAGNGRTADPTPPPPPREADPKHGAT